MSKVTRRQLIVSGLAASAATLIPANALNAQDQSASPAIPPAASPASIDLPSTTPRERLRMDTGWKFALGNANDPVKDFGYAQLAGTGLFAKSGAISQAKDSFHDASWKEVNLPHDWAEELPIVERKDLEARGAKPLGREFPETSVGWYRKQFRLAAGDAGKRIQVVFDGIYRNAAIYVNGHYITTNFSGYAPCMLDITDWVSLTALNELTVRVDATLSDGWFYEGAGIYRHVWLIKSDPIHLVEWGTYIRSTVSGNTASLQLG